jgi:hypothetical protein
MNANVKNVKISSYFQSWLLNYMEDNHMSSDNIQAAQDEILEYIAQQLPDNEQFRPKKRRTPRQEKLLDNRDARHSSWILFSRRLRALKVKSNLSLARRDYPHHQKKYGLKVQDAIRGFSRPSIARKMRHRNGQTAWMKENGVWVHPNLEGKSSRLRMHLKERWWQEAQEALGSAA